MFRDHVEVCHSEHRCIKNSCFDVVSDLSSCRAYEVPGSKECGQHAFDVNGAQKKNVDIATVDNQHHRITCLICIPLKFYDVKNFNLLFFLLPSFVP